MGEDEVIGMYEGKEHRCGCQPGDAGWREREWAGYDIAALIELCHLCVRGVMPSGTRWSWYACETCRDINNRIATAILGEHHPRNQILPLGRSSIMNGAALGLEPPTNADPTERFGESMMGFFDFTDQLIKWKREEGQRLLDASGLRDLEAVPLDHWLEINPASPGASAEAMARFIDEEDLPDISELDDLRRQRQVHLESDQR